ncbi:DMT family transporter [Streptomyces sp. NPDC048623]|uniref:DMT family transporter n=1 Tax=Streptomyces sp. NPDC048623 TaxID=3155761 RepID=UPI003431805C
MTDHDAGRGGEQTGERGEMRTEERGEERGGERDGRLVVPGLATLMVLLLATGWLLSGHLVSGAPALAVAAGRTAASFAVITAVAALLPRARPGVRTATARPGAVAVLAFLGFFAYYSGTLLGTSRIGASRVGLIVSLLPCLTFLIGIAAFREPSTRRKLLGTLLAVAAACGYAVADGGAGGAAVGTGALLTGGLMALGGTFAYALYGYVYRQRMADVPPLAALPAITGAGTVMLGAATLLFVPLGSVDAADWAGIAVLGAVLTAPVFVISHELILRKGPLFTSAVALAVPFLVRLGEWALGTAGPPGQLVVALIAVCAAGVWLTVGGPAAAPRPATVPRPGHPDAETATPGQGSPGRGTPRQGTPSQGNR